jgi:hypothetical protein
MKNKIKLFNIITLAVVIGFLAAGCNNPDNDNTDTIPGETGTSTKILTGTISITGTAQVGQALSANTGSLEGSGTISYQWKQSDTQTAAGTNISGATLSTYTLVTADESKFIKVTVTRSGYTGSVDSGAIGAVLPAQAETPTVTSITLAPATTSVLRGATQKFTATADGTNNPPQTVTWSVMGGISGTTITDDGTLTVAAGETATTLTVKATSTFDNSKSGTVTVTVIYPTVTNVTVNPTVANVNKGETQQFTATVIGNHNPAQTVTWSVTGGVSGTTITEDGTLTVAFGQPAGDVPTLTVKATSTVDNTKSGTAMVTVKTPPLAGSVTITGTAQEGHTLTANTENLAGNGNGALSYQWTRGSGSLTDPFTDISGATSSTYIVATADIGKYISVTVTRSGYDGSKIASAVGPIIATATPSPTVTSVTVNPTTADVLKGGTQQFTATVTGTNNPSTTVTWTVSGGTGGSTAINTSGLLTVSANETSATLTVKATSTIDTTKSATATVTVPALSGTVSINGTTQRGSVLTADTTSLNGTGTISYQWKRGDTATNVNTVINTNATSSTYTLATNDVGKFVKVTVTRAGYRGSVDSNALGAITNPALSGTVSISGTTAVGSVLTASTTSLGGSGDISYQWKRGNTSSDAGTNIGTNSSTYTLLSADDGKYIKVTVTRAENTGSVNSNTLGPITLPALSGTVSINGTPVVGQQLTAVTTSLNGSGTIGYQWKRGDTSGAAGTDISGATENKYTLVTADNGKYIKLTVTRSGNNGSVTSSATAQVSQPAETVVSTNNGSTAFNGLTTPASTYDVVNLPPDSKTNVMKVIPGDKWAVAEYSLSAYKNKEIKITLSVNVKRVGAAGTLQWQVNNNPGYPVVASKSDAAVNTWHSMSGTETLTPTGEYPSLYLNNDKSTPGSTYYIDNFTINIVETSTGGGGSYNGVTWTNADLGASSWQKTAKNDGYDVEMWNEDRKGTASMTLGVGGAFKCAWNNIRNVLFRAGRKFGETQTHTQIGTISIEYKADKFDLPGAGGTKNAYLSVYGWITNGAGSSTTNLVEYYIIENYGEFNPGTGNSNAVSKGSATIDGAVYNFYEIPMTNRPSIKGNTNFTQYLSIRQTKRMEGTISVSEHFKAWNTAGMTKVNGQMYEVAFKAEAYGNNDNAQGSAEISKNILKINGVPIQ